MPVIREGDVDLSKLRRRIRPRRRQVELRQAKIINHEGQIAVDCDGPVVDFATTGYTPQVGHTVWVLVEGPSYVVLGRHIKFGG